MARLEAFPPIATPEAKILILGSMPGAASLGAQRYYAHPHNQFWPIMATLLGFDPTLDYASRCDRLSTAGIAVWDVLQSCRRQGSLDAAIERDSIVVNDFGRFFTAHPRLQEIFFNGSTAEQLFRKHVTASILPAGLHLQRLPSTSPAHASLRPEAKLQHWRQALQADRQ
ncbi:MULTISPECIES: DNA-deoxyinosine glycosylase [unclassified Uliginosibacterium]|uniref:DNA-deoxyinosine glycosylase n=1 Tax=unclassified Uliginosibacterium TaxID=2621521 RepID=UPI000C7BCCFC|nr:MULTISPECIES: DNA-deoxyinosine glycosylase [unclassified Uliginosibacterium]MDO6385533.1 DNA-deoxyinosine glycosylase [Uliginosibacterium sp. 31-12]PLK47574.1 DNA-deoxyinosine glycosylase [Uliginosibacterium sp. TH139]